MTVVTTALEEDPWASLAPRLHEAKLRCGRTRSRCDGPSIGVCRIRSGTCATSAVEGRHGPWRPTPTSASIRKAAFAFDSIAAGSSQDATRSAASIWSPFAFVWARVSRTENMDRALPKARKTAQPADIAKSQMFGSDQTFSK